MTICRLFLIVVVLGLSPTVASAQVVDRPPFAWDVARAVLVDPTTYAPAVISYEAVRRDWKTSQPLLQRRNPPPCWWKRFPTPC